MLINEDDIIKVTGETHNYRLGTRYYHNISETLRELEIIIDPTTHNYNIYACIQQRNYENELSITITPEKEIRYYWCDCPYCVGSVACAHIVAVLKYIAALDEDTQIPFNYNFEETFKQIVAQKHKDEQEKRIKLLEDSSRFFIEKLSNDIMNGVKMHQNQQLFMIRAEIFDEHYFVNNHNSNQLSISFKIGSNKPYVIQNIDDFIEDVEEKRNRRYGKFLEFIHSIDVFDESSQIQIAFIKQMIFENTRTQYYPYKATRNLIVEDKGIDHFFDCYKTLNEEYINLNFEEEEGHFTIVIQKESLENHVYYKIELADKRESGFIYFGEKYIYVRTKRVLTRLIFDENNKAFHLFNKLLKDELLIIKEEDMNDFCKFVLSNIDSFVSVEGVDILCFIHEENRLCLYADFNDDNQMYVSIECEYDEEKAFGFDESNQYLSLSREIVENYIKLYVSDIDYDEHKAYLQEEEKIYRFIQEGLPYLSNYCEIFISDALKNIGNSHQISLRVGVSVENDLLEIDVDSVDIDKDELFDVLKSYRKKKKFYRLKNGDLIKLESKDLEQFDQLSNDFNFNAKDFENGRIIVPNYRAFALEGYIEDSKSIQIQRSQSFQTLIDSFHSISEETYKIPNHYESILRDYQKFGYQWLKYISQHGFGAILADDMGLGKTLQCIALLESEKEKNVPNIVVCPASILLNWQDEILKFTKDLSCLCIYGDALTRKLSIMSILDYDVVITSYDYIRRDIDLYEEIKFKYIILDEAQYIKNQKTKNAISVKKLKGQTRLALTGTPIENSLAELWSIFDFLMPNYLYNYHYFQSKYEKEIVKEQNVEVQSKLKRMVTPFILRRNKIDVLKELPDKIEKTLKINFHDEERKLYLANLMQVNKELQSKLSVDGMDRFAILAMLTRLRQICCEPRLVFDNIYTASSKLQACMELIESLHESNKRILLFSSFTSTLDLIEVELRKHHISYLMLTGRTDKEERRELVRKFQEENTEVFLISLKAGGTGLNLTAAEAVIHFDPWWNVSAQNQATDRAYRIGQDNNVQVFKLIMKDSIEEKIVELQDKKKNLADSFVENNEGIITTMSKDDIVNLLTLDSLNE